MTNRTYSNKFKAPKGVLIYLLGFYVLLQFCWWAYMLVNLNSEIYDLKLEMLTTSGAPLPELQVLKAELDQKLSLRVWMVLGEGAVFMVILLLGFWAVRRSIAKELRLAEQQKNFLLSVTHELKSPLAAVKLQLQTLQSRQLPEDKRKQIYSRALADSNRLEKLVENLLLVNKIEAGRLPLEKEKIQLSVHLDILLMSTYSREMDKGRIEIDIAPNVLVDVDSMALDSVIINLVDNSLKYGNESTIFVSLTRLSSQFVQLSVADGGDGIPDSEKDKIFERFYRRGNEDVRKTKGTGIGLYLVKLLVTEHNGEISVLDNSPKGAKFVVKLPCVDE